MKGDRIERQIEIDGARINMRGEGIRRDGLRGGNMIGSGTQAGETELMMIAETDTLTIDETHTGMTEGRGKDMTGTDDMIEMAGIMHEMTGRGQETMIGTIGDQPRQSGLQKIRGRLQGNSRK